MTPREAIKTAQLILNDWETGSYEKDVWIPVLRTLLPLAIASVAYHEFIHPHTCGNRLPVNFAALDEQELWKLLLALCEAADRDVQ